jgi:apolipoprotein N-acyltransferase
LVILPETGVPFFIAETPEVGAMLAQAFPRPTQLLTGSVRREHVWANNQPTTQYFNSLQRIDGGHIAASYDKHLLVPFGEFIPLRQLLDALPLPLPLRVLSQARLDFTHGTASPLLPTAVGPVVGLICYEGIFPLFVASHSGGARALVNVTNDAWFTGTSALYQHAALQRLRAIETGLPLLRSANTGISFATDGFGRILGRLPPHQAGVLDIKLPAPVPLTPWKWMISGFSTLK